MRAATICASGGKYRALRVIFPVSGTGVLPETVAPALQYGAGCPARRGHLAAIAQ